jgi:hypothetical protein
LRFVLGTWLAVPSAVNLRTDIHNLRVDLENSPYCSWVCLIATPLYHKQSNSQSWQIVTSRHPEASITLSLQALPPLHLNLSDCKVAGYRDNRVNTCAVKLIQDNWTEIALKLVEIQHFISPVVIQRVIHFLAVWSFSVS